ncbi:MAG: signal peptidase II [Alphaproteobacteria bacterium]|nr:signal peptidase II [Alphaproteobacteria bacterium]
MAPPTARPLSAQTRAVWSLSIVCAVLAADQALKWYMLYVVMQPPRTIELTSFFNLVMVWNRGISFGLLTGEAAYMPWLLSGLAFAVSLVLLVMLWRVRTLSSVIALASIIGGAIGNVFDRLRFGAVADFFDFHVSGYHWPAFNLADAAITCGVILLLWDGLFEPSESIRNSS